MLSVDAVKEMFRDLFKKQEQTLIMIVADSIKLIHQRLDELGVKKVSRAIKAKQKIIERITQVKDIQKEHNQSEVFSGIFFPNRKLLNKEQIAVI